MYVTDAPLATEAMLATIRARRVDDTARQMMREGMRLTWEQADDLGDEGAAWLRERLGLVIRTEDVDRGVEFRPGRR